MLKLLTFLLIFKILTIKCQTQEAVTIGVTGLATGNTVELDTNDTITSSGKDNPYGLDGLDINLAGNIMADRMPKKLHWLIDSYGSHDNLEMILTSLNNVYECYYNPSWTKKVVNTVKGIYIITAIDSGIFLFFLLVIAMERRGAHKLRAYRIRTRVLNALHVKNVNDLQHTTVGETTLMSTTVA